MQQCLAIYIMSNDAMMTMNGIQAAIADVKNPDARRHLSRDAVDTLVKDEGSTCTEAAYLRLGLLVGRTRRHRRMGFCAPIVHRD